MKCKDATASHKMKADEIEARLYVGLPQASSIVEGVVKIDNKTIRKNVEGEIYVANASESASTDDGLSLDHIEDTALHLNNKRRSDLDVNFPNHIKSSDVHFTGKVEKDDVISNVKKIVQHLKEFHAGEFEFTKLIRDLSALEILLSDHSSNTNIHLTPIFMDSLDKTIAGIVERLNLLDIADLNLIERCLKIEEGYSKIEGECIDLKNNKLDAAGHMPEVILGTDSIGNVVPLDINISDLAGIAGTAGALVGLLQDISDLKQGKADKTDLDDHIENQEVHFTAGQKEMTLERIEDIERKMAANTSGDKPGLRGQVNFIEDNGTAQAKPGFILYEGAFVFNTDELENAKEKVISFEDVFNKWIRFSHSETDKQPANESETKAWKYDALKNRVICTVNSATHIGFISDETYDNYIHEATLLSTDTDNDMIGVVIAYLKDREGIEHTLTAIRTASLETHINVGGALTNQWAIVYNYKKSNAKIIATKSVLGDSSCSWSSIPNGSRVRISRAGNIIQATTSKLNSTEILPETMLSVDLNSDPILEIFKVPCGYGYSCLSQNSSSFTDIFFSGGFNNAIYDLPNNEVWIYNGATWVKDLDRDVYVSTGVGKFLYNPNLHRLTFIKDFNSFVHISTDGIASASVMNETTSTKTMSGTTSERPANQGDGFGPWFDTEINKAIWFNNGKWVDALGIEV